MCGVRGLHAGLRIQAVVDHHDREVARPLHADGGKRAYPHQHLAIAGGDDDAPPPFDVTQSDEYQEAQAEIRREFDAGELEVEGERDRFPPTHYDR